MPALLLFLCSLAEPTLVGLWETRLALGGISLPIGVEITSLNGVLAGAFADPEKPAMRLPLNVILRVDRCVILASRSARTTFIGRLRDDGEKLEGTWITPDERRPITLKRVTKYSAQPRPQMPRPPFPYRSEEVSYLNKLGGGHTLTGTLTLPTGQGPFPTALLISGSGQQDRDCTIFGHKMFWVLADHLSRNGFAVLRVDDRGVGKSTGEVANATSADFAGDVRAGLAYLRTRPEIDGKRLFLIGHSEGGLIAPMVAVKETNLAGVVLLAGTAVLGKELMVRQLRAILATSQAPPALIEIQSRLQTRLLDLAASDLSTEELQKELPKIIDDFMAKLTDEEKKTFTVLHALGMRGPASKQLVIPWFRFFIRYDPRPALEKLRVPILALNGEKDVQVLADDNLGAIEAAARKAGNKDVVIRKLPNLNHLFQPCKTGAIQEYGTIETTIAPIVLETVTAWLKEHAR